MNVLSSLARVRQIVCPVIPGTPKSVVGPLDILPGCSVGTLDLALAPSVNITAIAVLAQTRDRIVFEQVIDAVHSVRFEWEICSGF